MNEEQYLSQLCQLWKKFWPEELPEKAYYPFGEIPLTTYLKKRAELTPDKPCVIFYGKELTFKQLDDLSDRFASFCKKKGLKKGDRVAVYLPNCTQYLIVFYGVLKMGCILVPINPMFKTHELLYEINDTKPKVIVVLDQLYPNLISIKDDINIDVMVTTSFEDALPENPTIPVHEYLKAPKKPCPGTVDLMSMLSEQDPDDFKEEVGLDDVVILNYTSGTTGFPKGCAHTQRNMIYTAASLATFNSQIGLDDVGLIYFPIFWIAGEDWGIILPVFSGATIIMLARWDTKAVLEAIERYRPTFMTGTVDNYVELMEHPEVEHYNLQSLKVTTAASFIRKITPEYRNRWYKLTGSVLRESAYGLTETHTMDTFTTNLQKDNLDLTRSSVFCGFPMPGTELKIVDFESGELKPLNEEGEIVIRSPSLFKYYWNKPEEYNKIVKNGWLHTGDIGLIDENGMLHFLGRRKEMLKVKGMSVFPSEVESLISRHEGIEACAVIGKPDEEKGEVPVAFVKLSPQYVDKLSEKDLEKWCYDNMAGYKVPIINIVSELPLTTSGKVKKEELKKLLITQ